MISIKDIIQNAVGAPDPSAALRRILEDCLKVTGAGSARLYSLRLSEFAYKLDHQIGSSSSESSISMDALSSSPQRNSVLAEAILSQKTCIGTFERGKQRREQQPAEPTSRLVAPITRDDVCLGAIDLEATRPDHFTEEHIEFVETLTPVCHLLFEMEDALKMFLVSQQPLDFSKPIDDFLDDAILLIAEASGMPYVVLRKQMKDENLLRCVVFYGFGNREKSELDLSPIEDYLPFKKALESGDSSVELDMAADYLVNLHSRDVFKNVRSFVVCPVKVGTEVYGTLSFAAGCFYPYSRLVIAGFESIANGVGVAITNYENFHNARDRDVQFAQAGAALTAVEVAQVARHAARGYLEAALTTLANLSAQARKGTRESVAGVVQKAEEIGEILKDIERTLNRIRDVTKPPQKELKVMSLRKTWDESFSHVQSRLAFLDIEPKIEGPDVEVEVYPDFLKHAWLNLILNSIDAFRERRQRGRRIIAVTIDPSGESATDIRIRYMDNATGIDPSKLRPKIGEQVRLVTDIFEAGVSSKEKGGGYGLALVRKILNDHSGSIDLVDYRNGVVFDIKLKKRLPG